MKRAPVLAAAAAGMLVAGGLLGPLALKRVGFFRLRRLELIGVRYLAPDQLATQLRLRRDQNLFEDAGEIVRRAEQVAGVVSAKVERRLPGTLRVVIVEREPLALAPGPDGLVVLGERGPLPYDPAATGLELPLVPRPDSLVLSALARVRAVDSALYQEVDAAERGPGGAGAVILEMGQHRVMVQGRPTIEEVQAVAAVHRYLRATRRPYTELDARFAGWVVARRGRS